jgi:hypothetical protein
MHTKGYKLTSYSHFRPGVSSIARFFLYIPQATYSRQEETPESAVQDYLSLPTEEYECLRLSLEHGNISLLNLL